MLNLKTYVDRPVKMTLPNGEVITIYMKPAGSKSVSISIDAPKDILIQRTNYKPKPKGV